MPAWLIDIFARYGYAAIFFGVGLENAGLPVPGETTVLAGGALSHAGHLSLALVIVTALAGAILGDNAGFAIGRQGGRRLVERYGDRVGLSRAHIEGFDRYFERHGPKTVFVARFVTGLRVFCAILAGGSGMSWATFLFYNASGAIVWSTTIAVVGYFLGHSWDALERLIGSTGLVGLVVVAVLVGVWILRLRRHS